MAFYDIFSKKKLKEKSHISQKIIIDNREKNSLVISELMSLGIKVELKQLEVADYIIGDIAIERKTISDLISSMTHKRIFSQLENLRQYESPLVIVEGYDNLNLKETNLSENAIRGLLLSILLDYKVPIIFTKDPKETAIYITLLAKKKKTEFSLRSKIQMSDNLRLQFIIEGFPSIGPITAKKLLSKHKTIKEIINTSEDELKSLLGKKADRFIELLNKAYEKE